MMKKIIIILLLIIVLSNLNKIQAEEVIIPHEAIRLRVIANSNTPHDQHLKTLVRDNTKHEVYQLLKGINSFEEARVAILSGLPTIKQTVEQTLKQASSLQSYEVTYGDNYFPEKQYKGVKYQAGYYESLLIKLGKGQGDNWWCVLFPPLCLIEADEASEVEYKFFITELINQYFKKK
ncbi:MAG: stage II sporulation protein R [Bacilli bacterium]|nr:stage II sporulation protein R [Bacilli bacterium]